MFAAIFLIDALLCARLLCCGKGAPPSRALAAAASTDARNASSETMKK